MHITNAALKCLMQYDWPGNVRELENCIERAFTLRNHDVIDVFDLPPAIRAPQPLGSAEPAAFIQPKFEPEQLAAPTPSSDLEDIERMTIQRVFEQVNGDKTLAGKMLGISRATLYRKLKRYNLLKSSAASA